MFLLLFLLLPLLLLLALLPVLSTAVSASSAPSRPPTALFALPHSADVLRTQPQAPRRVDALHRPDRIDPVAQIRRAQLGPPPTRIRAFRVGRPFRGACRGRVRGARRWSLGVRLRLYMWGRSIVRRRRAERSNQLVRRRTRARGLVQLLRPSIKSILEARSPYNNRRMRSPIVHPNATSPEALLTPLRRRTRIERILALLDRRQALFLFLDEVLVGNHPRWHRVRPSVPIHVRLTVCERELRKRAVRAHEAPLARRAHGLEYPLAPHRIVLPPCLLNRRLVHRGVYCRLNIDVFGALPSRGPG